MAEFFVSRERGERRKALVTAGMVAKNLALIQSGTR